MSKANYQGQCLCGAVKYEADMISDEMGHCHCSMCQKFHGAAFSTFASARRADFRWVKGEHVLQTYIADNGTKRQFCSQCGSSLIFESSQSDDLIEFSVATLDVAPRLFPDAHIYTGTKVDWVTIDRHLPKHFKQRC